MPTVNHFGALAARLKPKAAQLVKDTAIDWRDRASDHSRVDTTSMKVGWYAVTADEDGYAAAVDAARAANEKVVIVDKVGEATAATALVGNVTSHAAPNEYGSSVEGEQRMTAQPMLHPARDEAKPAFDDRLARLFES